MEQVVLIVWRECIEALLVVGILHTWLVHEKVNVRIGLTYLWAGVLAGVLLAGCMAYGMMTVQQRLLDEGQAYLGLLMLFISGVLMIHMVFWMRRNGRALKQAINVQLALGQSSTFQWRLFLIAMLAVAREGCETVVFLYGIGVSQSFGLRGMVLAGLLGLVLAYVTFLLLQLGGNIFSWRRFFQMTEIVLLCIAASFMVSGVELAWDLLVDSYDGLAGLTWVNGLTTSVWDTSDFISDHSFTGGLLKNVLGYRSQPTWCNLLTWIVYWIGIAMAMHCTRKEMQPSCAC
jgi:high-affinity iron transporter